MTSALSAIEELQAKDAAEGIEPGTGVASFVRHFQAIQAYYALSGDDNDDAGQHLQEAFYTRTPRTADEALIQFVSLFAEDILSGEAGTWDRAVLLSAREVLPPAVVKYINGHLADDAHSTPAKEQDVLSHFVATHQSYDKFGPDAWSAAQKAFYARKPKNHTEALIQLLSLVVEDADNSTHGPGLFRNIAALMPDPVADYIHEGLAQNQAERS